MAHTQGLQSPPSARATAGLLSFVLHVGLLMLVLWSGGSGEGLRDAEAPEPQPVRLDAVADDRQHDRQTLPGPRAGDAVPPETPVLHEPVPPSVPLPELGLAPSLVTAAPEVEVDASEEPEPGAVTFADVVPPEVPDEGATPITPPLEADELLRRIESLAGQWVTSPSARVTWEQDGRRFSAELVLEPPRDGVQPERAIAEVSAEEQGRKLRTWIRLKRLPFSHFAQVIDRWDPMIQLHDDEVAGRMHVNSRFNVMYDADASPRLLGKVTTAAGGYTVIRSGRRRDEDVFAQGIETGTRPIPFSGQGWSFQEWGPGANARVHELEEETWIRFLAEEGYMWREGRSGAWQHAGPPGDQPVHFVAAHPATVHLRGIASGRFLVHSARRIVVEGNLTYARDPRLDPGSEDMLGLVSERDIEVAPPSVTGPGDLHIQAALFARRRIVVTQTEHRGPATLHIYGSLAAGTLSESEPRYATKVEFDGRFERSRPPGFPSTNRFAAEDWDRQWTELPVVPGEENPAGW